MGQRGVYATIQKNPETGEYVLEHVTVQWALHLHHVLNYLLQDPERTQADKCLNVLKNVIRDCGHISAIEYLQDDYKYFEQSVDETRSEYLVYSRDKKECFCVGGAELLKDTPKEYRFSVSKVFKTRKAAEKFIFTHNHVQDAVSLLWDLDANTFTWFTEGDYYSIRAYNFATGQYKFCCRVTYSFEQMKAPEIEDVEFDGRFSGKDIIPLFGDSSSPSEEGPEKGETYTPAHLPGETINYTMQRHDDGPAITVTGSIYSVSTPRVTRNFQGLTYTATLDTRFGFDTWVYKLMQNGKQVWRWSHTPKIDGHDGDVFLEGLYTAVATYDPDDMTEKMTKGLLYNDPHTVFDEKIGFPYGYRQVMDFIDMLNRRNPDAEDMPPVAKFVNLLTATYRDIEEAETQEDRDRHADRCFTVKRDGRLGMILGGARDIQARISEALAFCSYQNVVSVPVRAHGQEPKMEALLYTKEGYSQPTIALLLGVTVKQVAALQRSMADK